MAAFQKQPGGPPLVIAHRGLSSSHPENTLSAFRAAIKAGVEIVELDVQFSKDGEVIVIHDSSVDRTTGAKGNVGDLTVEELKALDAGAFKGDEFKGEQIPTLAEVLELFSKEGNGTKLLIELKFTLFSWTGGFLKPYKDLDRRVVELVQKFSAQGFVLIQSFLEGYLETVRSLEPSIPVYLLMFPWRRLSPLLGLDVDAFNPSIRFVSKGFIDAVHNAGKKVFVWTVDSEDNIKFCLENGVDGIITNVPPSVQAAIESFEEFQ